MLSNNVQTGMNFCSYENDHPIPAKLTQNMKHKFYCYTYT